MPSNRLRRATLVAIAVMLPSALLNPAMAAFASGGVLPRPSDADRFGYSVDLNDDGSLAVVGSPGSGPAQGRAYVFSITGATYSLVATLMPSDGADGDGFGASVAIDGQLVVVGAANAVGHPSKAYMFVRPKTGWDGDLMESAQLVPSSSSNPQGFGMAVDVDGLVAVVADQEGAFVYVQTSTGWTGTMTESATLTGGSASSVAIDGTVIVTGDPAACTGCNAHVYERPLLIGWRGAVGPSATLLSPGGLNRFGTVAIDGDTVVVGAPGEDITRTISDDGAAYVFVRSGATWTGSLTAAARLHASVPTLNARFGRAVAVEGDTVVVGASGLSLFAEPAVGWAGDLDPSAALGASINGSTPVDIQGGTILAGDQALSLNGGRQGNVFVLLPDADADFVPDAVDNWPAYANHDQADLDVDGAGDVCDADDDADGAPDGLDNCPSVANADQADVDQDGAGDGCDTDDDDDGIGDASDNCPANANGDQLDTDADRAGNACDTDDDGDGDPDAWDNCALVPNPSQFDLDADGAGDRCDGANRAAIDVLPGVSPNVVRASGRFVPVAILGTPGFDPASRIDRATLRFGRLGTEAQVVGTCRVGDVNGDGIADLTCDFEIRRTGLGVKDRAATLSGTTLGLEAAAFSGTDAVTLARP